MNTEEEVIRDRADLDPTPVADLEQWHSTYDPYAAAALDRRLDEAFGPISIARARRGAAVQGKACHGGAGHGPAGRGEAPQGAPTKSGSAEAEPPTTGSIA